MRPDVISSSESPKGCVRIGSQFAWILVVMFALGGPMIWFHRASNCNLISFHGSLHTAISQRFVDHEFPPENPYFAGERVLYYWPYHYLGYLVSNATAQNVLYSFEQISLFGLAVLAAAAVAVGRMLFRSASSGAIVALFVLAGSNPLGWGIALAKYLRDGSIVLGDTSRGVTGPMLYLVQFGDHRLGPNFTYWMHTTARAASLGLALVVVVLVFYALRKLRIYILFAVILSIACCTGINPLIGLSCCGALLVGLGCSFFLQRVSLLQTGKSISAGTVGRVVLSIVVGALLALPTFWHMVGGGVSASIYIEPFRWKLWASICVNGMPLLILSIIGVIQAGRSSRYPLLICLFGGFVLMLLTGLLRMPGTIPTSLVVGNEHNFFNLSCVFLALPAAAFCVRESRGEFRLLKKRVFFSVLLFLPTTLVVMSAYAARPARDVTLEIDRISLEDTANPYSSAYNWIYNNTESNAIIVLSPFETRPQLCNISDLPAMTGRVLFVDHSSYMTEMYPDLLRRCTLAKELAQGVHLAAADIEYMKKFDRPIYVFAEKQGEAGNGDRLSQRYGSPSFDGGAVQIYRWMP